MVWSESIGQSLIVPGDKDTTNPADQRDFIELGATVPDELVTYLDAGLFFRSGKYVTGATYMQVKYFGMGSKGTYFFLFVYVENYKNVAGSHKLVNLSSYLFDDDYSLLTTFGPYDQGSGQPITAVNGVTTNAFMRSLNNLGPQSVGDINNFNTTWFEDWNVENGQFNRLKLWITADGMIKCKGFIRIKNTLPAAGAVQLFAAPMGSIYRPQNTHRESCHPNMNQTLIAIFDVQPDGNIVCLPRSTDIPGGAYLPIDWEWPTIDMEH